MTSTIEHDLILIVDDTPSNLEVLSESLADSGIEVAIATSGKAALKQLEYASVDLILLDIMMPEMDGFETCRLLKANERTKDIPIIFMTALSDSMDKLKGFNLGAVDYITKPFQKEEVLARTRVHLQLRKFNRTLEYRVAEQTAELHQMLEDLKQTQTQLVQSEKMSSLGQLVAGVAHEVNNPVNFIYGNLAPAKNYVEDLIELVDLICQEHTDLSPIIRKKIKRIDFEFIREDLPRLLSSMEVGADRIRQIVLSLRNFSRLDEAGMKPVELREGIESTLLILQSRLKECSEHPEIKIVKRYDEIPKVECYANQLNQVFMNLLCNAIDSLEEAMVSEKQLLPEIHIETQKIEDNIVRIIIADNGPGIAEVTQTKLFEPFFTTKPVGKGTGLGLAISHRIVTEEHQGSIYCISSPGKGAKFVIEIPIRVNSLA